MDAIADALNLWIIQSGINPIFLGYMISLVILSLIGRWRS